MSDGPVGFGSRVASIPRLVRDTLNGSYDGLGTSKLLAMAIAVLYIVSPIDFLPEGLLTVPGLLDDAAVGGWLIASLLAATTAYRAWESGQRGAFDMTPPRGSSTVIPGEVIHN